MTPYLTVGLNAAEAEKILTERAVSFTTVVTRPTRDFFKTDDTDWRVVREQRREDGSMALTLAAKQVSNCNRLPSGSDCI